MTIHCDACNQDRELHGAITTTKGTFCRDCRMGYTPQQGVIGLDEGRKQDILDITQKLKTTTNPKERLHLQNTLVKIKNEPRKVRDMRHALIREMRNGNAENVQDINRWVEKRSDYQ